MLTGPCRMPRMAAMVLAVTSIFATSGCAVPGFLQRGGNSIEASAVPARPMEPLAAFAGRALPGQEDRVEPSPGAPPVPVRLTRAWFAGSGRQCREVSIGSGREPMTRIFCQEGASWVAARPLLQSGGPAPRA